MKIIMIILGAVAVYSIFKIGKNEDIESGCEQSAS